MTAGYASAPWPVLEVAIEPKSAAHRDRIADAISGLSIEDRSLQASIDAESGQTILMGMSERHLDQTITVLSKSSGVALNIGAPQVAYREVITESTDVDFTHKTQASGVEQCIRVKLRVEPIAAFQNFELAPLAPEVGLPEDLFAGFRSGVASAMTAGIVAGFPVVSARVKLVDWTFHASNSPASAFEIAARAACREALRKGGAALIEPIMAVEVSTPTPDVGAVVADMISRRAEIIGQEPADDRVAIKALAPLANLFGYPNTLRSLTRSGGAWSMSYAKYARVPSPDDGDPPVGPALAMRP